MPCKEMCVSNDTHICNDTHMNVSLKLLNE